MPRELRRYYATAVVDTALEQKVQLNEFFEMISTIKDFRVPSKFVGTIQQHFMQLPIFLKQNTSATGINTGIKIIYKFNCYVNATFMMRKTEQITP